MSALNTRSRERGIALLSVVAVLVLLAIIATPFLVTMRDGAQRGKAVLAEAQAAKEAETAFRVAAAYLTGTHDSAERWAKDSGVKDQPDTPDWDTLEEFQIHETLLRNAGLDPENGRIWGVTIEDESAKINVNSAPFPLLGRFFGTTRLLEPADEAATDLNLESDGGLPARDGVVRLGDEVVQYDRREGSVLRGCKRGYKQDVAGNGPPRKHGAKALVVNEIAFQISAYPILARRGKFDGVDRVEYAPYQNLYEMRRISDLGVAALSADEFDRVADHLTVASRGIAGHVWGDPQNLRDPIKAGEDGHMAKLRIDNPQRYGMGTLVRISDGTHTDYGVVFGPGGNAQVEIVPATLHDYDANLTRVEAIIRHPVNVNTASVQVLTALFAGICRHAQDPLDADTARSIAERLVKVRSNEQQPAVRSLKDLKEILRQAVRENVIRAEEATAVELNALNPMETAANRLAVGSMPMGFKSGEVFTVTARAAVLDRSGQESGRRSFRRVVDVNPQGTAVIEIAGQYDLDEMLRVSNAKHLTTFPLNVGTEDRGTASPPSRFTPFFKSDRWPSRDRTDEEASVRALPSRLDYGTGRQAFPEPEHFDDDKLADGHSLSDGRVSFGSKDSRVSVSSEDGLEPFAASLWFKPRNGSGQSTFIIDGGKQEWEDRVGLFMDGERRELVLRVKDTSRQDIAAELRYPFDKSTWTEDTWYHLHLSVLGSRPDQMSMTIDGVGRGKPTLMTWTTASIDATGEVTSLGVEDASSFPETGALLLRGPDGVEVMEYSARSDASFTIRKRFARFNRADTVDAPNQTGTSRSFPAGACVTLYGYSIPTASRIPQGQGSLAAALGRMNVLVLDSQNPPDSWPNPSAGSSDPTTTGGGGGGGGVSGILRGWRGDKFSLNLGSDVHGWDGADGTTAAKAFGSRGLAVLCSGDGRGGFFGLNGGKVEFVQDSELVEYTVNGGTMEIIRKPEPTKWLRYTGTAPGTSAPTAGGTATIVATLDKKTSNSDLPFVPQHSYGNPDSKVQQYFQYYSQEFNGARPYADTDRMVEDGLISVLIPLSVEASGDLESFIDPDADQARTPETGFIQIGTGPDTEWVRYNTVEQRQGLLQFIRDRSIQRVLYLFRNGTSQYRNTDTLDDPNPDPDPNPNPDPDPDDPGDEPPAPPPPEDDGGGGGGPDAPPAPPDPGPGEDDGPGSGTPDTPPLPPDPGPGEDDGPPDGGPDVPPEPGPDDPGEDDGPPDGGPDQPPEPGPDDPGEDDGPPDGDPDAPPEPGPDPGPEPEPEPEPEPTPEDPGDTDSPPDPTTPGGPTTGGGGTVKVPFPLNEIARYLDFRTTFEDNTADEYKPTYIGDLANANLQQNGHASGAQVLPCFLVAFPGVEYDPQGDGTAVEYDYDSVMTSGSGTAGGAPTTGGGGSGGVPNPPKTTSSNGSAAAGDTGDDGNTGSADLIGQWIEPGPGEDDEVTLVAPGEDGARESHVVNWSHRRLDWNRARTFRRTWTWVAFQTPVEQEFGWSSDRLSGTTSSGMAADAVNYSLGRLGDSRKFVRLLKSPSGELPSRVPGNFNIGADYNGGASASAVVDEVRFASARSTDLVVRRGWFLGTSPVAGGQGVSITAEATTLPIHVAPGYAPQTNAPGVRTSGGLLRIGDELIGYAEFDAGTQSFTGLERGAMGTEARAHTFGVPVTPVHGIAVSRLSEGMSASSSRIPLANSGGFPIYGGFVRIGTEVLGYTRIGGNGVLEMPVSRSRSKDSAYSANAGADTDSGDGLFRARYGTEAGAHDAGAIVYHLDHRFPDFSREKADHPQLSWYTVSRESRGAVWKRVSWDARLASLNGIRVIVRFEGGPAWDSDKMVRVGTDPIPEADRSRWLYEITDPHKENLLNVQSDRIECRVFFNYDKGAFNPEAGTASDSWKETPQLKAFRIEYVAPASVITTEDLR